MQLFPYELRILLRRASLSQAAFARICQVSIRAVNRWCCGKVPIPGWVGLLVLAAQQIDLASLGVPSLAWYEVLGVPEDCDLSTLRLAFWRLAKQSHPDVGGDTALMQRINEAYDEARPLK